MQTKKGKEGKNIQPFLFFEKHGKLPSAGHGADDKLF